MALHTAGVVAALALVVVQEALAVEALANY
jgi:hypothetical protein